MQKTLFIDRDGTLLFEPKDGLVRELKFIPGTISALKKFVENGFKLILISNQDGLGTPKNPTKLFEKINEKLFEILASENVKFDEIFVCPHVEKDACECRKPRTGLLTKFLIKTPIDPENSFVIGDRETDLKLAENLGIRGFLLGEKIGGESWKNICNEILNRPRIAKFERKTAETDIKILWNLDGSGRTKISTGIGFFDHILENFAHHGNFDLDVSCVGDTHVDGHHTIEDIALALGKCFEIAVGEKRGIERFSDTKVSKKMPMDESICEIAVDISGRPFLVFDAKFDAEKCGDFPTEMTEHFFRSFCETAKINLNLKISGQNSHHKIEIAFKSFARVLRDAVRVSGDSSKIPSTKNVL